MKVIHSLKYLGKVQLYEFSVNHYVHERYEKGLMTLKCKYMGQKKSTEDIHKLKIEGKGPHLDGPTLLWNYTLFN